jgi:hypothetical protein
MLVNIHKASYPLHRPTLPNKSLLDLSILDNKCVTFSHNPQLPYPLEWPQAKVDIV